MTRTEIRTVPKLEFIPVPDAATAPCLVPLPPVDSNGELPYELLPAYLTEVLGVIEKCNLQLSKIKTMTPSGSFESNSTPTTMVSRPVDYGNEQMIIVVRPFTTTLEMQSAFRERTKNAYPKITPYLRAVTLSTVIADARYCELYVVMPKIYLDPEWNRWGHELGHCVFGEWHPLENWE